MNDFMKDFFGKNRNDRKHALFMLGIYSIFIVAVIIFIRTGNNKPIEKEKNNTSNNSEINNNSENNEKEKTTINKKTLNDINYSYSYKAEYDGKTELYIGKRVDDKEKFSYIYDNKTEEYAIIDDNYFYLKDGIYHIIDKLETYFKYCVPEKVVNLIENLEYEVVENKYVYNVSNSSISNAFNDEIASDGYSKIELTIENNILKVINMDLSNYVSSDNNKHSLNIYMEFANVGTTEDFEIKLK